MDIDSTSHRSPNFSERGPHRIEVGILHATVGGLQSSLNWLCSRASNVSAHYVIAQTGAIYRLVDESKCAWHAGVASWGGAASVNERSIGIELENRTGVAGVAGQDPYPQAQLTALQTLARDIASRYPGIAWAQHLDVALPKGRKTDPKGFDFRAFTKRMAAAAARTIAPPPREPAFNPARYRVRAIPISQVATGGPPYAGTMQPGDYVEIDLIYTWGYAHLTSGAGFVRMADLEPAGNL